MKLDIYLQDNPEELVKGTVRQTETLAFNQQGILNYSLYHKLL